MFPYDTQMFEKKGGSRGRESLHQDQLYTVFQGRLFEEQIGGSVGAQAPHSLFQKGFLKKGKGGPGR